MKTKLLILFITLLVGYGCSKENAEPTNVRFTKWIMVITGNVDISSVGDPVINIQQRFRDTTFREWNVSHSVNKKITVKSNGPNESHIWFRSEDEWRDNFKYDDPTIVKPNESFTFETTNK